jgi:uncharacterized membrane protein YkvA (DUF1232 family)
MLKLLFLLAALYVVLPVDAVPDVVPVFGWLDDLGVAALAVAFLLRTVRAYEDAPVGARAAHERVVETSGVEVR